MADLLDIRFVRFSEKLALARERDGACLKFGAGRHRYRLGPTLSVSRVVRFEEATGLELPPDFRRFIVEIGNGGAGPGYGWSPFNPEAAWQELFCHRDFAACVQLSDHGCGMFDFLVLCGSERGRVWFSDDQACVHPLMNGDSHAFFVDWLEAWLHT